MKRPRGAKKRPKDKPDPHTGLKDLKMDDECSANFNSDKKHNRNRRASKKLRLQGVDLLNTAGRQKGEEQIETYMEGLTKLRDALKKDNFSAAATRRLAEAYARLAKKGCAIMLLKRLVALQGHPDRAVVRAADLEIKNASNSSAFKKFRNDANTAIGE